MSPSGADGRARDHRRHRTASTREDVASRVNVLLEALPYIREFAGATIVIKYGGAAMTTPELKASFARDVALLKLVGMNPVIVHGGGPDISRYSDRLGLEVRFVHGLRVTDAPTMELVKMVLVGKINKEIVAQLHVAGVSAVGLAGDDGGLIQASKASSPDADLGFVGQVAAIDTRVLERLLATSCRSSPRSASTPTARATTSTPTRWPARWPRPWARGGRSSSPTSRASCATTDDPASLISECRLADIRELAASGAAGDGMLPKLAAIADALEAGVEAVQVIDGRVPHSVLVEIFTEAGIGTKITA